MTTRFAVGVTVTFAEDDVVLAGSYVVPVGGVSVAVFVVAPAVVAVALIVYVTVPF